jgi:hypothetical protein
MTRAGARIDRIEALIHHDVGRNTDTLFAATRGGLARMAEAMAREQSPRIGLVTGFFVPDGQPPAAETDGPVGVALLAAGLTGAGLSCRVITDGPCADGCAAALRGANLNHVPLDVVPLGASQDDAIATWRNDGITWAVAIERCGRSASGPPRNMRGGDISPHTQPLDDLFRAGPWATAAIGDGGNELGTGALPWDLVAAHVAQGDRIACVTPADHLVMAGVSHWGCYALAAALAILRPDWRSALLACLDPVLDLAILQAMLTEGPAVDGVTLERTPTIDGLAMAAHHERLSAIKAVVDG